MSRCIEISDVVVQSIVKTCTNLQYLALRRCRITNRSVHEISVNLPMLNFLDISGCDRLNSAIVFSLKNCLNLSELKIGGNSEDRRNSLYRSQLGR